MLNVFKNATVISVMPAMGKTFFAAKFPVFFRDLESSDYHWTEVNGEKVVNPDWPKNYIDAIKNLEKSGMYKAVFVSSHELVREEMKKAGIRYANLCPVNTNSMRQEILARCVSRKNTAEFINNYNKHWEDYINSMLNDDGAVAVVQIDELNLKNWANWAAMF